jgi:hypothetical protein
LFEVIVIVDIVAYSRLSLLACGIDCFWLLPIHGLRLLVATSCSWLLSFTCGYYYHYLSFKWFWLLLPLPFICDYCENDDTLQHHFLLLVIANFFPWQTLFLTSHHCYFSFIPLLWIAIVIAHICFQYGANLGVQAR